jgi:hypothetical protein
VTNLVLWGDVPTWLTAIAAAVALPLSAVLVQHERRRRHVEQVGAWVRTRHDTSTGMFEALDVRVSNAGSSPVFSVHLNVNFVVYWSTPNAPEQGRINDKLPGAHCWIVAVGQELVTIDELGPRQMEEISLDLAPEDSTSLNGAEATLLHRDRDAKRWSLAPVRKAWPASRPEHDRLAVVRLAWSPTSDYMERRSIPEGQSASASAPGNVDRPLAENLARAQGIQPESSANDFTEYVVGAASGDPLTEDISHALYFAATPSELGNQYRYMGQFPRTYVMPIDRSNMRERPPDHIRGFIRGLGLVDVAGITWLVRPHDKRSPRRARRSVRLQPW